MYAQFDPPDDLKHFVCFFYQMEYSNHDTPLQALLPSGTEIMGWQYTGQWQLRMPAAQDNHVMEIVLPPYYTIGQQVTSYQLTALNERTGIMGVMLQPGSLWQCFRKPATTFTQHVTDTRLLFAYQLLHPALTQYQQASDTEMRLNTLVRFYREVSRTINWERSLIDQALAKIYQHKGCITVHEICASLHINERYLQRHFKLRIGVTVQQYIGIMRFNNVFAAINTSKGEQPLEIVALLHNYYDLSHFNKEYKKYFGIAPRMDIQGKFGWLRELISDKPYNLTVQNQYLEDAS